MKKALSAALSAIIVMSFASCTSISDLMNLVKDKVPNVPSMAEQSSMLPPESDAVSDAVSDAESEIELSSQPDYIEESSMEEFSVPDQQNENHHSGIKPENSSSSGEAVPWLVYGKERYNINIFLSNFSEQDFGDYDSSHKNHDQLIEFAYLSFLINNESEISGNENGDRILTLKQINRKLDRYLGTTISKPKTSFEYYDGKFFFPDEYIEPTAQMTVSDRVLELPNGNFEIEFKIYSVDKYKSAGKNITNKDYYYADPVDAMNDSGLTYVSSGTAIVKNVGKDDFSSLKLIKYHID